jgi:hypothetical protein
LTEELSFGVDGQPVNCIAALALTQLFPSTFSVPVDLPGGSDKTCEFLQVAGRAAATYVNPQALPSSALSRKQSSVSIWFFTKVANFLKLPRVF